MRSCGARARALRQKMSNATDGVEFDTEWGSANVNYAIAVSIGAGASTGLGGALVFFPSFFQSIPQSTVLAVSLALSAGVMLYVSFIEIFSKVSRGCETSTITSNTQLPPSREGEAVRHCASLQMPLSPIHSFRSHSTRLL